MFNIVTRTFTQQPLIHIYKTYTNIQDIYYMKKIPKIVMVRLADDH